MSGAALPLKRHLLAMLGGGAPPELDSDQWAALDAMAEQHRLRPLLAWRAEQRGERIVPEAIARAWREAWHTSRLVSLTQLAGLRASGPALDEAGIPYVALKGPRLVWRCYPDVGLRPMRDLDLLVPEADVMCAVAALAKAGFALEDNDAALAAALSEHRHLPPLWHAGLALTLELHHRITDPPGYHSYHVPQIDPAGVLARRETIALSGERAPCPTPTDLLTHLMVHALYGHRLDCGPLVLADIHFLLQRETIEPEAFRRAAEAGGWQRGADLLLALTARYFGPQLLVPVRVPPESVLAAAEEMLLQDFYDRELSIAFADLLAPQSRSAWLGAVAKRLRPDADVVAGQDLPLWRFWPRWAWRRAKGLGGSLADPRAGREARRSAALLRWLQG